MSKNNYKRRYAHITSGLLLFSTVLSTIAPTATAVSANQAKHPENKTAEKKSVNDSAQNSLADRKASLNQMAGFSISQGSQADGQMFSDNSSQASSASSSAPSSASSSANSSQATNQVTIDYQFNNQLVGKKTYNIPVGQSVDTATMPTELRNHYQATNATAVKVDTQSAMDLTVQVKQINDGSVSGNVSGQASQASSASSKASSSVAKPKATPLPSRQYTRQRTHVVNPMFQPNYAPRISNSSDYKQEVPMDSSDTPRDLDDVKPFKNFSKSVLRYKPYMDKTTAHYHIKGYETLLLAIMQNESRGQGSDVMQSSESLGLAPNSLDPQQSIEQATRYMSQLIKKAQGMDKAEQSNKKISKKDYHYYANDNRLLAQTYNYGGNFLDYVAKQKHGFNLGVSEKYSRDVVAPLLGNTDGSKYTYDNPISRMYHKKYLYTNGGNYFYSDLVEQYAVGGYMHNILSNLIKYSGQEYVFGGKTPHQGFDCSGLTSYGFKKLGVKLPSYTVTQWHMTKGVKGGLNNAKPGDLIFFKGTYGGRHFVSHVGFVVDRHTMFDADSDGVGFHNLDNAYWKKHFAGVRRVPQAHKLNHKADQKLNKEVQKAVNDYK